jgi:hypothetical protein
MKIFINKRSNGNGRLVKSRDDIQEVVMTYMNGSVKTASGDVWECKPSTKPGAELEAIS